MCAVLSYSPNPFILQLVCEEVNVDRFYPVLYPKVSTLPPISNQWISTNPLKGFLLICSGIQAHCHIWWACDQQQLQVWGHLSKVWTGESGPEVFRLDNSFVTLSLSLFLHLYLSLSLLFFRRRHQRRSCSATWKKVPPSSSSWSFWATRSSSTTLKGSKASSPLPQRFASCFWGAARHSVSVLLIRGWIPEKRRFRVSWHSRSRWHCDGVGSRSALGVLSVMDERELTGRSQWCALGCSAPNAALFVLAAASPLFCLCFFPSPHFKISSFLLLSVLNSTLSPSPLQIPRRPGCHSRPDGDGVRLHQFP